MWIATMDFMKAFDTIDTNRYGIQKPTNVRKSRSNTHLRDVLPIQRVLTVELVRFPQKPCLDATHCRTGALPHRIRKHCVGTTANFTKSPAETLSRFRPCPAFLHQGTHQNALSFQHQSVSGSESCSLAIVHKRTKQLRYHVAGC